MTDNDGDRIIASLKLIEQFPFIAAIGDAIPNIQEIERQSFGTENFGINISFKDGNLIYVKGLYEGMPNGDAIELVQLAIAVDQATKDYYTARDNLRRAFQDDEAKIAKAHSNLVADLNDKGEDVKSRRKGSS